MRATEDSHVQRSLASENETAIILAAQGYRVKQNPSLEEIARAREETGDTGRAGSEPDYLVEGRVFDCYAPSAGKSVRNTWSEVLEKVANEQTQRVVINLQNWGDDVDALRRQFADWPIDGLKEVKAVTRDRRVVQIWTIGKA